MRTDKHLLLFGLTLLIGLLAGCSVVSSSHDESLLTQLEHESDHVEPVHLDIEQLLIEFDTVEVEGITAVAPFHATARTADIEKFPCSTCHEAPLGELEAPSAPHWDITLNHASADVMQCTTCHEPQNLDTLHSLTNAPIEFDHSYQLCAQCHSPQFEDWIGGAHGKRLEGWAPPRVVETCVGCHNPHEPALGSRWPAVTGGGVQEP